MTTTPPPQVQRRSRPAHLRVRLGLVAVLAGALGLAACSGDGGILDTGAAGDEPARSGEPADPPTTPDGPDAEDPGTSGAGTEGDPAAYAVDPPGAFDGRLRTADVLITSRRPLSPRTVRRIADIPRVAAVEQLSWASVSTNGRTLDVVAVDPDDVRRFMPVETAQADFVWERLAGGELVVGDEVPRKLVNKGDLLPLGAGEEAPEVHVGAYAPLARDVDVLMNPKRGEQLGIPEGNALLVSTGDWTPSKLTKEFRRVLDGRTSLRILALEFDVGRQQAVLTGGSVTQAIGTFSYTNGPNGTVRPEQRWVQEYIRREEVPILGLVTCNKGMLPQLRGALTEVVAAGLADKIHPEEYAGCYYPRYIGRDPSNGLSLHSWGIAVDLNVPGNLRGTRGEIDRRVVAIFKRWGFAWGGDWNYTDPMHFEMARVVRPG